MGPCRKRHGPFLSSIALVKIKPIHCATLSSQATCATSGLYNSITRLVLGLALQISTQPGSGSSSGSSKYSTSPSTSAHMQVWQMPERQL